MSNVIVLAGLSGEGKSTIEANLKKKGWLHIRTNTTRTIRPGETDGVNYNFRTVEEFEKLKKEGYFLETNQYANNWYGMSEQGLREAIANKAHSYVTVMEYNGAIEVKRHFPKEVFCVHVFCPEETVKRRLAERGASPEEIALRIEEKHICTAHLDRICDLKVVNDDVPAEQREEAIEKLTGQIIEAFRKF